MNIQGIYLSFSAGRRDVNDIECRWCGTRIHKRPQPGSPRDNTEWYDGGGWTKGTLPGAPLGEDHVHEPALVEAEQILGPFDEDFVQITYDSLRSCEGELIAVLDKATGDWLICEPWTGAGERYSDITIMTGDYKDSVED